jgi:hypothetical protein
MKIPSYRRPTRAEMGKVPSWVDVMLDPINRQLETITIAMQNSLSPFQNFASEELRKTLAHSIERQFSLQKLKSKPWAVIPVWADGNASITAFAWRTVDTNTIAVTAWFGNPDPAPGESPEVDVRLWVIGEGD